MYVNIKKSKQHLHNKNYNHMKNISGKSAGINSMKINETHLIKGKQ